MTPFLATTPTRTAAALYGAGSSSASTSGSPGKGPPPLTPGNRSGTEFACMIILAQSRSQEPPVPEPAPRPLPSKEPALFPQGPGEEPQNAEDRLHVRSGPATVGLRGGREGSSLPDQGAPLPSETVRPPIHPDDLFLEVVSWSSLPPPPISPVFANLMGVFLISLGVLPFNEVKEWDNV